MHINFESMTEAPVRPLIVHAAVPTIVSMLVSALYNMADTFFVSRINTQASAAVGIVFSYMTFIQALSFFFGQGSSMYIARALGAHDVKNAERMAATGFFSVIITGTAIACLGLFFTEPLLRTLGSTDTVLPQARGYIQWILLGTPFIMSSFTMNSMLRFQGSSVMAMAGIASGAILNVILDPLLIFGLDMGTEGASMSTMISQIIGFSILLKMTGMRGCIPIKLRNFRPSLRQYREIAAGGTPSLARQGLAVTGVIFLNRTAGIYGDAAVAAFSVVSRCAMFSTSIIIGFGQGFQPMCAFNLGAGRFRRVRDGFRFCLFVTTGYCTALAAAGFIFAPQIVSLFRPEDADFLRIAVSVMRRQCAAYPLTGFVMLSNMYLQVAGMTLRASITSVSRKCLVYLPVLYIADNMFGLEGIMYAQAAADIITFAVAAVLTLPVLNSMEKLSAHAHDSASGDAGSDINCKLQYQNENLEQD